MLVIAIIPIEVRARDVSRLTQPFDHDVRVWRTTFPASEMQTNIPRSVVQHSPDGFECGYSGSGPADFALNILNAFLPPRSGRPKAFIESDGEDDPVQMYRGVASRFAMRWHQKFKFEFITSMPRSGGVIEAQAIRSWIAVHRAIS